MSEEKEKYLVGVLTGEVSLTPEDQKRLRLDLIKRTICKGATDDEFALFMHFAERNGLDPEKKHVYPIKRWDKKENRYIMTFGITVDGYRHMTSRSGKYQGQLGPFWCGPDGKWLEFWVSQDPPIAAKVGILIRDYAAPVWGIATFKEFVQTNADGKLLDNWQKMPSNQLAKCAEVQAHRKAVPQEDEFENVQVVPYVSDVIPSLVVNESPKHQPKIPAEKKPATIQMRPFDLEHLKAYILEGAEDFSGKPANGHRGEVAAALNHHFANDDGRREFTAWLCGKESMKEIEDGIVLSMYRWLSPVYNKQAARFEIDSMATQELDAWVAEYATVEGDVEEPA